MCRWPFGSGGKRVTGATTFPVRTSPATISRTKSRRSGFSETSVEAVVSALTVPSIVPRARGHAVAMRLLLSYRLGRSRGISPVRALLGAPESMKRLLFMLSVALVASIGASVSPGNAPTAEGTTPCVYIYRVYFDSPGSDSGSTTSLNAEWIRLKNHCATSKSLSGWRIKDKAGHTYTFGTFSLKPGYYVTVHTGKGTNT